MEVALLSHVGRLLRADHVAGDTNEGEVSFHGARHTDMYSKKVLCAACKLALNLKHVLVDYCDK